MLIVVALVYFVTSNVLVVQSYVLSRRVSEDSCRISLSRDLPSTPPLMIDDKAGTLLYPSEDDVIVMTANTAFLLYCPSGFAERRIQPRGITVLCKRADTVVYNNTTYRLAQLGCIKHPDSSLRRTQVTCLRGNHTLVQIGYEYSAGQSHNDDEGIGEDIDDSSDEDSDEDRDDDSGMVLEENEAETVVEQESEVSIDETGSGVRLVETGTEVNDDETGSEFYKVQPETEVGKGETGSGVYTAGLDSSNGDLDRGDLGEDTTKTVNNKEDVELGGFNNAVLEDEPKKTEINTSVTGNDGKGDSKLTSSFTDYRMRAPEGISVVGGENGGDNNGRLYTVTVAVEKGVHRATGDTTATENSDVSGGNQGENSSKDVSIVLNGPPRLTGYHNSDKIEIHHAGGKDFVESVTGSYFTQLNSGSVYDVAVNSLRNFQEAGGEKLTPLAAKNDDELKSLITENSGGSNKGRVARGVSNNAITPEGQVSNGCGRKTSRRKQKIATGNCANATKNGVSDTGTDTRLTENGITRTRSGRRFNRKRPHGKRAKGESSFSIEKEAFRRKPEGELKFIKLIDVCYDLERYQAMYAVHRLDERIRGRQHSVPRINFKTDIFDEERINVNYLYSRKGQIARLTKLLSSADLANEYIRRDDHFLSRGHYSPKADFVHAAEQTATFYYINVAPQWQTFNGGNWVKLEDAIRDLIVKEPGKFQVYTGSNGVISLKDINNKEVEIYLGEWKGRQILPVPKYYWKVIYNPKKREGIAVVGLNNPYHQVSEDDILCEDICRAYDWLDWDTNDQKRGVMFCCTLPDFQQKFIDLGLDIRESGTSGAATFTSEAETVTSGAETVTSGTEQIIQSTTNML